jgi:hypothetical protein
MDKILYVVNNGDIPQLSLQPVLSPFLLIGTIINFFRCSGNSSLFQIELIGLWTLECNAVPPAWINFDGILSILRYLYLFIFSVAISTSKDLDSAIFIYIYQSA